MPTASLRHTVLLAYDSESLTVTQTVGLANTPNSMVVAPNGATAYLGSAAGLMVVNLTSYQSTIQNYPIVGGLSTDVVTGAVLGVSPDSRYVLVSDVPNGLVFLIDTTGTKTAMRYSIPGITAVTFAADDSNFWIGGTSGVYIFQADTFVPISSLDPCRRQPQHQRKGAGLDAGWPVLLCQWRPVGQLFHLRRPVIPESPTACRELRSIWMQPPSVACLMWSGFDG